MVDAGRGKQLLATPGWRRAQATPSCYRVAACGPLLAPLLLLLATLLLLLRLLLQRLRLVRLLETPLLGDLRGRLHLAARDEEARRLERLVLTLELRGQRVACKGVWCGALAGPEPGLGPGPGPGPGPEPGPEPGPLPLPVPGLKGRAGLEGLGPGPGLGLDVAPHRVISCHLVNELRVVNETVVRDVPRASLTDAIVALTVLVVALSFALLALLALFPAASRRAIRTHARLCGGRVAWVF